MPTYRVVIDGQDTGDYVTASSKLDAYFDIASSMPLTYETKVALEEVTAPEAKPGFSVGRNTISGSTTSTMEQVLWLRKPRQRS
jgi:hypothetical protein